MTEASLFERAKEIFGLVCDRPADERESILDDACDSNGALRCEVESLLKNDAAACGAVEAAESGGGARALVEAVAGESAGQAFVDDSAISAGATGAFDLPKRIGNYRIIRELGRGGMGIVYEAEQENPRRRVALKVIRQGLGSAQLASRFRQEAHVLGQLRHAGIAQIYEAGSAYLGNSELPYFAMELVEGVPLDRCAKPLGRRERIELMARVCDAVQHAHQRGVIHRDLKPANIHVIKQRTTTEAVTGGGTASRTMIDSIGQPKILDFGIARLTDSDFQLTTIQTHAGQIVGTLGYMSPEQLAGDSSALDTRCDVYALGVILYRVLAERMPHELGGKPIAEAARIIREVEPPRLGLLDRSLRGDIDTVVTKAIEKDPDRRYASAAALAEDLRRHLANEPITAHAPSAFYQIRKFVGRNKALVGGVMTTVVALVAGLAGTTHYLLDANAQRERAESQRDDLQAVQEWYGELISQVDVQYMGKRLMQNLHARVSEGLERDHESSQDVTDALDRLGTLTRRANATDFAIDALDLALFERAEQSIREQFADSPEIRAVLFATMGRAHNRLSRGKRALAAFEEAREAITEVKAPNPETISSIMRGRGNALGELNLNSEAITVRKSHLAYCRREFGIDHIDSIQAAGALAVSLYDAGHEEESADLLEDALATHAARYGEDDSVSIGMKTTFAWIELDRGREAEALKLGDEIVSARCRLHGPDDTKTLAALSEVGLQAAKIGRIDKAAVLLSAAVEGSARVLGNDHAATNNRRERLASALRSLGEYDRAIELLRQVQEHRARIHSPQSWESLSAQRSIALVRFKQSRYADAETLLQQCLPAARKHLGPDHRTTTELMSEIGRCLTHLGRFAEAEAILRETRAVNVAKNGEDHRLSVMYAELIAQNIVGQGRLEEAITLQAAELIRARRLFGDDGIRTMILVRDHMRALHQAGRHSQAEPLCRQFLAFTRKLNNQMAMAETLVELGSILIAKHAHEQALEALDEAISISGEAQGAGAARMRLLRGAALAGMGRFEEAEPIMLAEYKTFESRQDEISIVRRKYLLSECVRHVADMYETSGKTNEAAIWKAKLGLSSGGRNHSNLPDGK